MKNVAASEGTKISRGQCKTKLPHFSEVFDVLTDLNHAHEVLVRGSVGVRSFVFNTELFPVQKPAKELLVYVVWVANYIHRRFEDCNLQDLSCSTFQICFHICNEEEDLKMTPRRVEENETT